MPAHDFRRDFKAIAGLAVLLVVLTTVCSGLLFDTLLPGLGLASALALGAIISPTDAVAATAVGQRLGLPSRLLTILEGEGLVNDASSLVLLGSAVAAATTTVTVHLWKVGLDFRYAVAVAVTIGLIVGYANPPDRRHGLLRGRELRLARRDRAGLVGDARGGHRGGRAVAARQHSVSAAGGADRLRGGRDHAAGLGPDPAPGHPCPQDLRRRPRRRPGRVRPGNPAQRPTWRKAGRDEGFRIVGRGGQWEVRRVSRKTGEVRVPKAG
jgi:Sodium/hydrogen exchanger family